MSNLKKILSYKKNCKSVWFMRQAGRYLPEFRKIRAKNPNFIKLCLNSKLNLFIGWSVISELNLLFKHNFIKLCLNSKLSSEITLHPIKRFNLLFKHNFIKFGFFALIFLNSGKYRPACLINHTDLQFFL